MLEQGKENLIEKKEKINYKTYSSIKELILEEYLPYALQIGVDYYTFWILTPKKLKPFIKAFKEKEERELEKANFISWISGIYFTHSIATVMGEKHQYPDNPLPIFQSEEEKEERREKEADLFGAYAAMFNKQFEEKNKKEEE